MHPSTKRPAAHAAAFGHRETQALAQVPGALGCVRTCRAASFLCAAGTRFACNPQDTAQRQWQGSRAVKCSSTRKLCVRVCFCAQAHRHRRSGEHGRRGDARGRAGGRFTRYRFLRASCARETLGLRSAGYRPAGRPPWYAQPAGTRDTGLAPDARAGRASPRAHNVTVQTRSHAHRPSRTQAGRHTAASAGATTRRIGVQRRSRRR
jgi:hypothetical protein